MIAATLVLVPPQIAPANAVNANGSDSEIDYYIELNGSDQAVFGLANSTKVDLGTSWTVESWIKPSEAAMSAAEAMILNKESSYEFAIRSGTFQYALTNGAGTWDWRPTSVSALAEQWQHVAWAKQNNTLTLYLDGQAVFSKTDAVFVPSTHQASSKILSIGARQGGSVDEAPSVSWFEGGIDEVRIWSDLRTQAEIEAGMHSKLAGDEANLLAYWDFNESSGTSVYNRADGVADIGFHNSPVRADVKQAARAAGGDTVIVFPRTYLPGTGVWTAPESAASLEVLVVAGGGGGGAWVGAGGGAGGFKEYSVANSSGQNYAITVGQGGIGAYFQAPNGTYPSGSISRVNTSGQDSLFGSITVPGGGAGANYLSGGQGTPGATGGSGGGGTFGSAAQAQTASGIAVSGGEFGNNGGSGSTADQPHPTGGGGGAGSPGENAGSSSTDPSGDGGAGETTSLLTPALAQELGAGVVSGGMVYFAGGGGGSRHGQSGTTENPETYAALGGIGGGGAGSFISVGSGSYPGVASASPGLPNSGGGGGGAANWIANVSIGGFGGSGVIVVRYTPDPRSVEVSTPSVGPGASTTLSGTVSADAGIFILSLQASTGSFTLATLPTGVLNNSGLTAVNPLALSGSAEALNQALNQVVYNAPTVESAVTISALLTPVTVNSYSSVIQSPLTGHLYSVDPTTRTFDEAKSNASSLEIEGLVGYLATPSTQAENEFLVNAAENAEASNVFDTTNLYIGLSDAGANGYFSPTWSWATGPEVGIAVSIGHTDGSGDEVVNFATITGRFQSWASGEPNGNTGNIGDANRPPNCGVTNYSQPPYGEWDDVTCTSALPSLIEYGGLTGDLGFTSLAFQVEQPTVDIEFTELDFDYSDHVNETARSSVGSCVNSTADCIGKAAGDKVRFLNVSTRDGVSIDAVVTTGAIPNRGKIDRYEAGAQAGGENSFFEADITLGTGSTGVAFTFDFYLAGTYGTADQTRVRLKNVNVTAIDIDYYQYNDLTDVDGFTVASNTYLKTCVGANLASSCTSNTPTPSFEKPNALRFQGRSGYATNDERDMGIATYGTIETFTIVLGSTQGQTRTSNLFGVAFKALPWGGLTPVSTGETYTLAYNINGGSGTTPASQTGKLAANLKLAASSNFNRDGHTFVGWNTAANGSGTAYAAGANFSMPSGGDILYADWEPVTYQLTYVANGGGGAPASTTVAAGEQFRLSLTQPTRNGFTFLHWASAADGSGATYSPRANFTMPGSNTSLFAQWQTLTGTLTYDANGGTTTQSAETVTAGATVEIATGQNTARSGFVFAGWNSLASGTGVDYVPGEDIVVPQGTTTLYAKWTGVKYSIDYIANGGSGAPAAGSGFADSNYYISSTEPTRNGYTFTEWNRAQNGSSTSYAPSALIVLSASDLALYAQWTANSYSLSYDINAGDSGQPATQSEAAFSNATVASGVPVRSTYRFNGWNTAADGSGSSYATGSNLVMPAADVVLYAQWVSEIYDVAYNGNGGRGAPEPSSSSAGPISISSTVSFRTGYDFDGWSLLSGGGGTKYVAGDSFTVAGDVTFFARWIAQIFSLSYDVNGGQTTAPATVTPLNVSQSTNVDAVTPSRSGFVFKGWAESPSGTTLYLGGNPFQMPAADVTLYAIWSGAPFNLIYNTNGGSSGPADATVRTSESTQVGAAPDRTGFTFGGWNTQPDGSGDSYGPNSTLIMPASDVTLYAVWNRITRTISFDDNSGTGGPADVTGSYQAEVVIPATTPERDGFTFAGWNSQCDGSGTPYQPGDTVIIGTTNIALCAQWTVITYLLSYDANGGDSSPASAVLAAQAVVSASATLPVRQGYSFASWNTAANGSGTRYLAGSNFTMPASDTTLYALWISNPYAIYFNANGGFGAPAAQPSRTAESVTLTATTPSRSGYVFVDWDTDAGGADVGYSSSQTLTMPPNNLTLFAQWDFVRYTLSYDANGGTSAPANQTNLTVSQNVTLASSEPSRDGYFFNGWNTAADGSGNSYATGSALVMPASDTTLYAEWVADTFTVIYNANGGGGAPTPEAYSTSDPVTIQTGPTVDKYGHDFEYWSTGSDGSGTTYSPSATENMPAGGLRLFAQWTLSDVVITYNINGATGSTPDAITISYSEIIPLHSGTGFSKSGQTLIGWNTAADGSGTGYTPEQEFAADNITLYAQWGDVFYALEYNPAGGTGAPTGVVATAGEVVPVADDTPVKTDFTFVEWTSVTGDSSYMPGTTLIMPAASVILFANWQTPLILTPPSLGSSGGPPPVIPSASATVSPSVSPTVSPSVSPSVSDGVVMQPEESAPVDTSPSPSKPEINYRAKEETYDPDTFENWSSSEIVDEADGEPASEGAGTSDDSVGTEQTITTEEPYQEDGSGSWIWWLAGVPVLGGAAAWFIARRRRS
jgi:uncharacterized repeat protein (TIGR02543 family)